MIEASEMKNAYVGSGVMTNSAEFNGISSKDALVKLAEYVEAKGFGERPTKNRLKDWGVSRQRYSIYTLLFFLRIPLLLHILLF